MVILVGAVQVADGLRPDGSRPEQRDLGNKSAWAAYLTTKLTNFGWRITHEDALQSFVDFCVVFRG